MREERNQAFEDKVRQDEQDRLFVAQLNDDIRAVRAMLFIFAASVVVWAATILVTLNLLK